MNNLLLPIQDVKYFVEMTGHQADHPIVFLHGFTGSTSTWSVVREVLSRKYRVITVDLLGHGQTSAPKQIERYAMEQQIDDLQALFEQLSLPSFTLVGYSMGGRTAIAYAQKYTNQIHSLILESASPGLQSQTERELRQMADTKLANRILEEGIESFVDFWENIPLFKTQLNLSQEQRFAIRQERLQQRPLGLANSLRGMGTGSQPSYWEHLQAFFMPTLLMTGALDSKFVTIAREMMRDLPNAQHEIVLGTGHAIHVEKPLQFATIIEKYLSELKL